jgi:hypothetical protein
MKATIMTAIIAIAAITPPRGGLTGRGAEPLRDGRPGKLKELMNPTLAGKSSPLGLRFNPYEESFESYLGIFGKYRQIDGFEIQISSGIVRSRLHMKSPRLMQCQELSTK